MSLTDNFIDSLQRQLTNANRKMAEIEQENSLLILKVKNLEQELKNLRAAHIKALERSIEIGETTQSILDITNQLEKKVNMECSGTLKVKMETQTVSDRFKKREFVLTTDAETKYPQTVIFQLTQDKCNILDNFREGDNLKVSYNLNGKEYNGKYYNSLTAWKIEKV